MKLTSPKAYEIIKYLLKYRETNQFYISRETGVSYGWTNEVINYLYDRGIVSKSWRHCELDEPLQLLEFIALERPLEKLVMSSFQLEVSSIADGEELLERACEATNTAYGLTVFSGLKRFYEYYITFAEIHAYVSAGEVTKLIPSGRGPIRLKLLAPDQPSILKETGRREGFSICSPIQVVIDLFCSNTGRDAAVKLLESIHNGRL